jgi:RNA ligase (TIGR02306 family)
MSNRKLASIRRIKQLLPISGADKIELALVDGWQVVVKKGEFKENELAVYFEIDSFIPNSIAPFLTKEGYPPKEFNGVKGERLKTVKLRKTLSQGLLLPVSNFPFMAGEIEDGVVCEGYDLTDELRVQKWEAPEEKATNNGPMASKTRSFPYFIRKTDQERAQNYGKLIEQNLDTEFEVTVKKDGSSITVFRVNPDSEYYEDAKRMVHGKPSLWQRIKAFFQRKYDEPVYGICSRNVLLPFEGESNFHKAAAKLLPHMKVYNEGSVAIQAELVAPDIQGNYEKVDGVEVHIFDVFNIDKQEYMVPRDRINFLGVMFSPDKVPHATIVDRGTLRNILQLKDGEDAVAKLLTYASGEGDNPGVMREGVVFKAMDKDFSFKVVSNEYLLKKG